MGSSSLDPVLNLLNSVIFDFRRQNPSTGDNDVLLSLRRLRLFLKRREVILSSLETELFNGIVGISSLAGYGKKEILTAIENLEKIVVECTRSGRSYFETISRQPNVIYEVRSNN